MPPGVSPIEVPKMLKRTGAKMPWQKPSQQQKEEERERARRRFDLAGLKKTKRTEKEEEGQTTGKAR